MTTLDIHVDGTPRTQGSITPIVRATGGVFMKQGAALHEWRATIAYNAKAARPERIEKPRSARVFLAFDILAPKRSKNEFPKGDVDKLARACLDALTGICWDDDVQVTWLHVEKRWSEQPGVHIRVEAG